METNETNNPPILVTSDVKFAVMQDGSVIMDDETRRGPGWIDVAQAVAEIIKKADEDMLMRLVMADAAVLSPAMEIKIEQAKAQLEAKIARKS